MKSSRQQWKKEWNAECWSLLHFTIAIKMPKKPYHSFLRMFSIECVQIYRLLQIFKKDMLNLKMVFPIFWLPLSFHCAARLNQLRINRFLSKAPTHNKKRASHWKMPPKCFEFIHFNVHEIWCSEFNLTSTLEFVQVFLGTCVFVVHLINFLHFILVYNFTQIEFRICFCWNSDQFVFESTTGWCSFCISSLNYFDTHRISRK